MKRLFLLTACVVACLCTNAQTRKVKISSAVADCAHVEHTADMAIDGNLDTYWHSVGPSEDYATTFPVTFTIVFEETTHVDFARYIPRQDGRLTGNWDEVHLSYCPTTTGTDFIQLGQYELNGSSAAYDFMLTDEGIECGQLQMTIYSGDGFHASAAEIEAYVFEGDKAEKFAPYFADELFTRLKPEVTSSEGIEDEEVKALVDHLLQDAEAYKKFRVGEYEAYLTLATLDDMLKLSSDYNRYENPTGVYLKRGDSCWVMVSGITSGYNVGLTMKNWVTDESCSRYGLRNGINLITATTEGNVFVDYFTDDFEQAPNVKMHFINAPVQGYWDQATMTNEDWVELLKGRSTSDNTILITRSEHAQLAYPVSAWLKHCPTNVDSTMTLYQQVQWAERDILGLERYGRQVKNRQLFFSTTYNFMAAVEEGAYCNVNSLGAIMCPDAARFDFWGVGHEWGHNNQVRTGFKWSGCGESTNNIYASWGQFHFTGKRDASGHPTYLRLEDEVTGVGEYANMRGGRMQTYFEEGLRKGIPWQLQDGPDYYNTQPSTKFVVGYDANGKYIGSVTTTSRNYDHFVKLVPFWQLNLWGTVAGKCPDIIPMVIESIRSTKNYTTFYNTNGKKQVNWIKLACDSARMNLLPFFEKAGMLRPIHAYIEDYQPGWNIITEEMIAELEAYVKEQGYPTPAEEINYINGHNYPIYQNEAALETPETIGKGCKANGVRVTVQHSVVKNVVAFETYNLMGELLRITMYGLGSDDAHSYTQVLFPKGDTPAEQAGYIMAVGYDGTRVKIYEDKSSMLQMLGDMLDKAKSYLTLADDTGTKAGYFMPDYLDDYKELVNEVDSVVRFKDETVHSYMEWYALLEAGIEALLGDIEARVPIYSDNYYSIAVSGNSLYSISYASAGLRATVAGQKEPLNQWLIAPAAEEGTFYLQNRSSGFYISSVSEGVRVKAKATETDKAIAFRAVPGVPGEFMIQLAGNEQLCLGFDDTNRQVKGAKSSAETVWWNLSMIKESVEDAIESVIEEARPDVYYDLTGRRVENPSQGIYILNGKKVMIK